MKYGHMGCQSVESGQKIANKRTEKKIFKKRIVLKLGIFIKIGFLGPFFPLTFSGSKSAKNLEFFVTIYGHI